MPAAVNTRIWDYAFYNCSSLKSIVFPKGVENIRLWAFFNTPYQGIEVYNFALSLQGQSEGPTGLNPSKIHVPEGWGHSAAWSPIDGALVYDLQSISSLSINKTSLSIEEGATSTLQCIIAPTNASVKTLHWSSNNTDVAVVDNNGMVTGINKGTATITATSLDGSNLSVSCIVKVCRLTENLIDGEPFSNDENQKISTLTFTKAFAASTVGNWNAFYVPMSINVEEYAGKLDFAEIYAFCATVDTNGDGTVDANDENYLFVRPVKRGCIKPNVPYLIRPHEAKTYVINSADNILYKSMEGKVEFSTTLDKFTVTGLNDAFTVTAGDNNYYVTTAGKLSYRATGSTTVKANRWIMHRESKEYGTNGSGASEVKEYRIFTIGEDMDEETAIEAIKNSSDAININSGTIFTLDGKKVNTTHNFPNGIYIKNGKKYLVK